MGKVINTRAGWEKYSANPVLGGKLGTCFDISVLHHADQYLMYFSWRPRQSVAVVTSTDGFHWGDPTICLAPRKTPEGWEDELNRPAVVFHDGVYHMWYTGQFKPGEADGTSHIFYATSTDGLHFQRHSTQPVMAPAGGWEKQAIMCPDVRWDDEHHRYQMWYSGGEQYEPTAIGCATSPDGVTWTKDERNPIFAADPASAWEQHKAAACHVEKVDDWYVMFYIGYHDEDYAQIGMARSRDGITHWERFADNPIIAPTPGAFDADACYKPYALFDGEKWLLWYNGRHVHLEQVGVATHQGKDLGFASPSQGGISRWN